MAEGETDLESHPGCKSSEHRNPASEPTPKKTVSEITASCLRKRLILRIPNSKIRSYIGMFGVAMYLFENNLTVQFTGGVWVSRVG
jgi:hypothetical protein